MYNVKRKLNKITNEAIQEAKHDSKTYKIHNFKFFLNSYVMRGTLDRTIKLREIVLSYYTKALDIIRDTSISDKEAAKRIKKIFSFIRKITSQSKHNLNREFLKYMMFQINFCDCKEPSEYFINIYQKVIDEELGETHDYGDLKELYKVFHEAEKKSDDAFEEANRKYGHLFMSYCKKLKFNIEDFVCSIRQWVRDGIYYIFDMNYGESYKPII